MNQIKTVASGAALTSMKNGAGNLLWTQVTTAGTGTGNLIFSDGYKATDLAIDASDATKVTSSSHSFTSADVGIPLTITAGTGFTVGTYTIASVAGGAAFLSAAAGTVGSTSGTYNVGSAQVLLQVPATVAVNVITTGAYPGIPFYTTLLATNVANGPVVTAVFN